MENAPPLRITESSDPTSSTTYKGFQIDDPTKVFVSGVQFKSTGLFTDLVTGLQTAVPGEWEVVDDTLYDFGARLTIGNNAIHVGLGAATGMVDGIVEIEGPTGPTTPSVDSMIQVLNTFFASRLPPAPATGPLGARVGSLADELAAPVTQQQGVAQQLNFGEEPVQNRPVLQETPKFPSENPDFQFEWDSFIMDSSPDAEAKRAAKLAAMPHRDMRDQTLTDMLTHDTIPVDTYVLEEPGNHLVFTYRDTHTGIPLKHLLRKLYKDGEGVFYECTQMFPIDKQFRPQDIYADPFVEIALGSRFLVPLADFKQLLQVPPHLFWEISDTGKTLPYAASRSSVVVGAAVESQLHCQDGSNMPLFSMKPYIPATPEEEDAPTEPPPQIVTLQHGEVRTQIDISQNNTVLGAKNWYANTKKLDSATIKFLFMGRIMKDEDVLTPGTVVLVTGGAPASGGSKRGKRTQKKKSMA